MKTTVSSSKKTVTISSESPFVLIGEKINPTGRAKMSAELEAGDLSGLLRLAQSQVEGGADLLDVNVAVPGLDEASLMKQAVKLLSGSLDLPLCLDSASPAALAAGLAAARGKPLVNSVNGEERVMDAILPVVREYRAAVIGLVMDESGVPPTPTQRLKVAEKILERAARLGIPAEDVIIDPIVMAVGVDSQAAQVTLETIRLVREKTGANINLGASNVSHGLPDRQAVNTAFLALAIGAGATCAITDPARVGVFVRAVDLLMGRDEYAGRYLKTFRAAQARRAKPPSLG